VNGQRIISYKGRVDIVCVVESIVRAQKKNNQSCQLEFFWIVATYRSFNYSTVTRNAKRVHRERHTPSIRDTFVDNSFDCEPRVRRGVLEVRTSTQYDNIIGRVTCACVTTTSVMHGGKRSHLLSHLLLNTSLGGVWRWEYSAPWNHTRQSPRQCLDWNELQ
jgi:hypothetical protein